MTNPTARGWYWVWQSPKDVERLVSVALYWSNERGWHQSDDGECARACGTHRREFASWVGPLLPRVPAESRSGGGGEIERLRAGADATARVLPTAARVEQLAAFGRPDSSGILFESLLGLAVSELATGCLALLSLRADDAAERAVLLGEIERLSCVARAGASASQHD